MIDAVIRRKAEAFFLKNREHTPFEDCLVSAVFGPLRYMSAEAGWLGTETLLGLAPEEIACDRFDISFWPPADVGRVEADMVITAAFAGRERKLIIEVKWNAALGPDQLLRQSQGYGGDWRTNFEHHALVRQVGLAAVKAYIEDQPLGSPIHRLSTATWREAVERLAGLRARAGVADGLKRWADGCCRMIRAFGERDFTGFGMTGRWTLPVGLSWDFVETIDWPSPETFGRDAARPHDVWFIMDALEWPQSAFDGGQPTAWAFER